MTRRIASESPGDALAVPEWGRVLIGRKRKQLGDNSDFVGVDIGAFDTHTAILAQSGSGKSTLLSRLIEELILKTRARFLILDPNSDFSRLAEARRDREPWECDREDELGLDGFADRWPSDDIHVLSAHREQGDPIEVVWQKVPSTLVTGEAEAWYRGQVVNCHEYFRTISTLSSLKHGREVTIHDALNEFDRSLESIEKISGNQTPKRIHEKLSSLYDFDSVREVAKNLSIDIDELSEEYSALITTAVQAVSDFTSVARIFYRSQVSALAAQGILAKYGHDNVVDATGGRASNSRRVRVLDLPTISERDGQLLAVSSVLVDEWKHARRLFQIASKRKREVRTAARDAISATGEVRVPTFIVVEEAHNLVSGDSALERFLRAQFQQIAAEGRKYGLFLLLVSQRPDKIDERVISECGNTVVMRLSSEALAQDVSRRIGLQRNALDGAVSFGIGEALLCGHWARDLIEDDDDVGVRINCGVRRTPEGAPKIKATDWIVGP